MDNGRVAEFAPPRVLLRNPKSLFSQLVLAEQQQQQKQLQQQQKQEIEDSEGLQQEQQQQQQKIPIIKKGDAYKQEIPSPTTVVVPQNQSSVAA